MTFILRVDRVVLTPSASRMLDICRLAVRYEPQHYAMCSWGSQAHPQPTFSNLTATRDEATCAPRSAEGSMEAVRDQMVYNEHLIHASDVISVRLAFSVLGIAVGLNIRSAYITLYPTLKLSGSVLPFLSVCCGA
ncbi:hypothetical protein [Methyloglobulus sp.]|uniref:hypothetical protein n=1 Tax=Methyloglobulus sp. TaxID=2518622 RepID=UPI0032B7DC6E